jgi:hypothetical protein
MIQENPEGWNEILQGWLKLPDKSGRFASERPPSRLFLSNQST